MRLTKDQVRAVVNEVSDQLTQGTKNRTHLFKGKAEWEKLILLFNEKSEREKKLQKMRDEVEKMESDLDDFVETISVKVKKFEKKHEVNVEWRYLDEDEGEEPSFSLDTTNLKEKIERTISIIGIDTKEKITADMLIERMVDKFSKVS